MRYQQLNGIIKEIIQRPNNDVVGFLQDELQIPLDKAEVLAARIEKKCMLKDENTVERQSVQSLLGKPSDSDSFSKESVYSVDALSEKEFEHFIKWLLEELGYEVHPQKFTATWGVDFIATKGEEKITFIARRFPKTRMVSNAILRLAQEAKDINDCGRAIIVSTACFTEQAKSRAQECNVEFWDAEVLDGKIAEARKNADVEAQSMFPAYKGSLLQSLLRLEETRDFIIEPRTGEKYDLYLPGVKYPLLTFQAADGLVIRCVFRIKYNEPVGEFDGEALISTENGRSRPNDEEAYAKIVEYLELYTK